MFFKDIFHEIKSDIGQIGTRLRSLELKFEKIEEKEEEITAKIDKEIEDNKNYPYNCYNLLVQYCANGRTLLSGYQKYKLLNIIASDEESSYETLISFYCVLDAHERMMLISTLLSTEVDKDGDIDDNFLYQLINNDNFIFTSFEMNIIVSYILQQEAYFLVKPLTTKYVVPQYLADMLNSRAVLNNLTEQ